MHLDLGVYLISLGYLKYNGVGSFVFYYFIGFGPKASYFKVSGVS